MCDLFLCSSAIRGDFGNRLENTEWKRLKSWGGFVSGICGVPRNRHELLEKDFTIVGDLV
jgi:hypothetical protein